MLCDPTTGRIPASAQLHDRSTGASFRFLIHLNCLTGQPPYFFQAVYFALSAAVSFKSARWPHPGTKLFTNFFTSEITPFTFRVRAALRAPLRAEALLRFLPRPPPPFLRPPLSDLFTVAQARRSDSLLLTPRFL